MKLIFIALFISIINISNANEIVKEFEQKYKKIQTIRANFEQLAENNALVTGEFYLKKPNKIIWKYLEPYPMIILIKDDTLAYYDQKLDEVSYRNIKNSIFSVILGNHLNLSSKIISASIESTHRQITVKDQFSNEAYNLQFHFTSSPFTLKKLILSDIHQELSNITFTNFAQNIQIPDEIFTLPRKFLNKN